MQRSITKLLPLKATYGIFAFFFLVLSVVSVLNISQVHANGGLEGVSVTPDSFDLDTDTTYEVAFTAPSALGEGTFISFNVFYQGPQSNDTVVNLSSATLDGVLASSGTINGAIDSPPDFDVNQIAIRTGFGTNVPEGATVTLALSGVSNPSFAGQYNANVNINTGPGDGVGGNSSLLLGFGELVKTITGTVTKSSDNSAVTDAQINASQRGGQLFLNTQVDNNGDFTLQVPPGEWELRAEAQFDNEGQQLPVDWAYTGFGAVASFANDTTVETRTVDLSVTDASSTVSGVILDPDGEPLNGGGVDVFSSDGIGIGGGLNPNDGSFSLRVPPGSYNLNVFSDDQSYTVPPQDPFTVGEDEEVDLGTITLIEKSSIIRGTVVERETGGGVAGIRVNTWSPESGGWGESTTGSDGTFELLVGPGTWEVDVRPEPDSGYAFEAGPPTRIEIEDNETKSGYVFTVVEASSRINGRVIDADGNQLTQFFGFAMVMEGDGDPPKPGPGGEVQGGTFSILAPAGTWSVNVHTEPGSDFSSAGAQQVTVSEDETVEVEITMKQNDATISGTVKDEDGNPVTNVFGEVFAENGRGSFKFSHIDSDGTFSMGVVGGDSWYMGVFVDPSSGYMMLPPSDNKITVGSGETVTKDFTILKANATIQGRVLDPSGNGLSNVFVFADTQLSEEGNVLGLKIEAPAQVGLPIGGPLGDELGDQGIHTGDLTSSDGSFSLAVPAGTYGLGSGAPSALGFINPEFQTVTVAKDETKTGVVLQYKESDAQITGTVTLDGQTHEAFVWAWSENGAHSETFTRTGNFTLNVTSDDVWHIGADFEAFQSFYQSNELVVDLSGRTSATAALELIKSSFTVPPAVSQTIDAASGGTIQLEDGTQLVVPAGAFGSSGTFNVTITPTAQLTKEKNNRPLAFGYSITAVNASTGAELTSNFNSNVRLIMPYTEEMLAALGVSEDDISAKFFSTTSEVWQGVAGFTVNKEDNTIVATIQHFTDFALTTGSADSTATGDVSNIVVTPGTSSVTLSWTNPTDSDFAGVRIYRSTTSGTPGDLLTTTASTATSYEDTSIDVNTTYHYSLRAIDNAGNEAFGAGQVAGAAIGTGAELPATGVSIGSAIGFYGSMLIGAAILMFGPTAFILRRRR